jgi:hypothetical protein
MRGSTSGAIPSRSLIDDVETIVLGVVHESVDFVGVEGGSDRIACLRQRDLHVRGRDFQRPLQRVKRLRASDVSHGTS